MEKLLETIRQSLRAIRANSLRAVLTILIIGIGIMALIAMLTAVEAMKATVTKSFADVGATSFSIDSDPPFQGISGRRRGPVVDYPVITHSQARLYQNRMQQQTGSLVSFSFLVSFQAVVKGDGRETPPKTYVVAIDENFLATEGKQLQAGRSMTRDEAGSGRPVAIIGAGLKKDMFGSHEAIGKKIVIDNAPFTVIGVLEDRGSSFGSDDDYAALVGYGAALNYFAPSNPKYEITTRAPSVEALEQVADEGRGTFRAIRKLRLGEEDNFSLTRSDAVSNSLLENIGFITAAAVVIGFITLVGAAVALTNIMLVSVRERTREIGVRKAIGATTANIRSQFLSEAIIICQLGGISGIVLGIGMGNLVALALKSGFVVPWPWVLGGLVLCFATGIVSGLYPAVKAAQQDPVEALRYE